MIGEKTVSLAQGHAYVIGDKLVIERAGQPTKTVVITRVYGDLATVRALFWTFERSIYAAIIIGLLPLVWLGL